MNEGSCDGDVRGCEDGPFCGLVEVAREMVEHESFHHYGKVESGEIMMDVQDTKVSRTLIKIYRPMMKKGT